MASSPSQPPKAQISILIAEPIAANRSELEQQLATQQNISVAGESWHGVRSTADLIDRGEILGQEFV